MEVPSFLIYPLAVEINRFIIPLTDYEFKFQEVSKRPKFPSIDDINATLLSSGADELAAIKKIIRKLKSKHGL